MSFILLFHRFFMIFRQGNTVLQCREELPSPFVCYTVNFSNFCSFGTRHLLLNVVQYSYTIMEKTVMGMDWTTMQSKALHWTFLRCETQMLFGYIPFSRGEVNRPINVPPCLYQGGR